MRVDDNPIRPHATRSPRRNEVLFALRRGQDGDGPSATDVVIESHPIGKPARPLALTEDESILSQSNRQLSQASHATSGAPVFSTACRLPEFIGDHASMLEVSRRIRLVAPHRTPVLVEGPTGTGKELVARALHRLSPRSSRPTVNSLSDNPTAAGENVLLTSQLNAGDTFSQTASSVESLLQIGDTALGNVITQLTSAISLATEANNGTLNSSNEQSIATQLTGIRDEVVSLANSSYMGQYIFAGSRGNAAPFSINTTSSPATVTYSGDSDVSFVQTPTGQKIQTNVPNNQIFTAGPNVLGTLNSLIADFSSGTPSASSVTDLTNLNTALNYVGQQRVILDDSITRLTAAANYNTSESTQLRSTQDSLLQADTAQVATQLSSSETQQAALTQVIAAIDKQGTLFRVLP